MLILLAILFLITAALYASIGFGGGSTYNALLVLADADYRALPAVALICNIIVVSGGVFAFARAGHLSARRLAPWIAASVPAAWIGGRLAISETLFVGALGFSLLAAGLHLILDRAGANDDAVGKTSVGVAVGAGAGIGFLSGLVGIGGGIFLAPLLYFMRWGTARQIAAACSLFILVNSLSGLTGQLMKLGTIGAADLIGEYWTLFPAVLIGGQIGSRVSLRWLDARWIKRLTAVLILYISVRLLWRWAGMIF